MKLLLSYFVVYFSSAKINPSIFFSITSQLWRLGWAQLVVCSIQITAPERYKICYCVWGCPSPWDMWPEIKKTVAALPDTCWTYMIYIDLPVWIPKLWLPGRKCKRHIETPHHRSSFSILCLFCPCQVDQCRLAAVSTKVCWVCQCVALYRRGACSLIFFPGKDWGLQSFWQ